MKFIIVLWKILSFLNSLTNDLNKIRDLTASLLMEVCHEVSIEPDLQPITGETFHRASTNIWDGARLDLTMNGLWEGRYERSFCDVKIFNPHAPSNRNSNLASCYRRHERFKKNSYKQRIRDVEYASFTFLNPSVTEKTNSYSSTMAWLRCRLTSLEILNLMHLGSATQAFLSEPCQWIW